MVQTRNEIEKELMQELDYCAKDAQRRHGSFLSEDSFKFGMLLEKYITLKQRYQEKKDIEAVDEYFGK
jgi:hypothetical protein